MIIPAIGLGPLGAKEWSVGDVAGAGAAGTGTSAGATTDLTTPVKSGSFGDALTNAIGSLEKTQVNATQASQELATGQLTDPTTAITAVENASLSMDFASQIRNQVETAATTLFQTQV